MSTNPLAIYLKDHHAGSEAALEILDHLEASHADEAGPLARRLRPEFLSEREELVKLLAKLGDPVSLPRRIAGWLSEKGAELKLKADGLSEGPLHLLEAVELLGIGVHGKRGLWVALVANAERDQALAGVDYVQLIRQADAQRESIEVVRLKAARVVIGAPFT
ncbi:MAG: hypothetical protein M3Y05_07070 [Gemmatimonadota bacterium]|nr:hypothetical protein [Gemmatimonadota bacterium]